MTIKAFNLSNLKKISEEEIRLTSAVLDLFPVSRSRDRLDIEIRKTMMKHLGEKSFYYVDSVAAQTYASFISHLPEPAIIAVIGLEPSQEKLFVHIDTNVGFLLIDRLLGGNAEPAIENRPLSETETGVLQYLIMQILAQIWRVAGETGRYHFRFERMVFNPRDIAAMAPKNDTAVETTLKVGIGELAGFVKIVMPKKFMERLASLPAKNTQADMEQGERINAFDYVRTTLWADVGRATISSGDIITLEAGDVVLFDETGISLKNGVPQGEADLRVGMGEQASIRADIDTEGQNVKCTVKGA